MQVAHEIKNPLTPMKLGIQQLERRAKDATEQESDLREQIITLSTTLQGQIDLLVRIAEEFSTLARLPQGELRTLELRPLLEGVVALYAGAEAGVSLDMEGDWSLEADEDQLRRLLSNLMLNALQALQGGEGEVVLRAREDRLEVEDNGPGMPPEIAERAFEPQFTTRGSGSGLGLAMVKAIADRHGWSVEFDSELGRGTVFRVLLKS